MTLLEDSPLTVDIYDLLYQFGISAGSIAFFHTAYAIPPMPYGWLWNSRRCCCSSPNGFIPK